MKPDAEIVFMPETSEIFTLTLRWKTMSLKKLILTNLLVIICFGNLFSQSELAVGSWKTHFSFYNINSIIETDEYIYASSNNGLFRLNPETEVNEVISKIDGLSDSRIAQLAYHEELDRIIIAYQNGNLDLILETGDIVNINDILESQSIIGSKRINDIFIFNEFAFISCDFGLVKFDVENLEIAEDYRNLSQSNVSQVEIYSCFILNNPDSIYLTTSQGILNAPFNSTINLQDVNNWLLVDSASSIPLRNLGKLGRIENSLFTYGIALDSTYLFRYNSGKWDTMEFDHSRSITTIGNTADKMYLITNNQIQIWENENAFTSSLIDFNNYPLPNQLMIDKNDNYWIAAPQRGLLSNKNGDIENFSPNGPFGDIAARMTFYNNKIVVAPGGRRTNFKQRLNNEGYFIYENNRWTNYLPNQIPGNEFFGNYMLDMYEPMYYEEGGFLAIGSIGYGVLAQYSEDSFFVFNQFNSTLYNLLDGFASCRVSAMTEDQNGNLILSNPQSPTPINIYNPELGWRTLGLGVNNLGFVDGMLTDNANNIWCRVINIIGGIIVFNEEDGRIINLTTAEGQGNLPNIAVNAMEIDKEGDIWVGTNDGVAVFFNPENIFETNNFDANTPIFENRPLLREEFVTAIEIDAANRKWVGTSNGVWLFNPDGTEVIANFTSSNSPLLNDQITAIEINENNGEVFFATPDGIVSYRGTATELESNCDEIRVFPNPVVPGYEGLLSVYGLPSNSIVKFTDINGGLLYEGRATGNSISWNLRNYNNEKARTGIYLVLSSSEDGEETCVTKFAIVE